MSRRNAFFAALQIAFFGVAAIAIPVFSADANSSTDPILQAMYPGKVESRWEKFDIKSWTIRPWRWKARYWVALVDLQNVPTGIGYPSTEHEADLAVLQKTARQFVMVGRTRLEGVALSLVPKEKTQNTDDKTVPLDGFEIQPGEYAVGLRSFPDGPPAIPANERFQLYRLTEGSLYRVLDIPLEPAERGSGPNDGAALVTDPAHRSGGYFDLLLQRADSKQTSRRFQWDPTIAAYLPVATAKP